MAQRAGVGRPSLTNNVFNAGVNAVQTTMTNNADRRLDFERDRSNVSFTSKNGLALAERMHRPCNVPNDSGLPEAHRELAKSTSKS